MFCLEVEPAVLPSPRLLSCPPWRHRPSLFRTPQLGQLGYNMHDRCWRAGADVGGFFGNANSELIVRWNQLGTYYPFFRGHGHLETKRREPWLFGEDNTRRNRHSLRERYALLPYLYTLFWETHTQGTPIMRPLWYEFPEVRLVKA